MSRFADDSMICSPIELDTVVVLRKEKLADSQPFGERDGLASVARPRAARVDEILCLQEAGSGRTRAASPRQRSLLPHDRWKLTTLPRTGGSRPTRSGFLKA